MSHTHDHDHSHAHHSHAHALKGASPRLFLIAVGLTLGFAIFEVIGGYYAHSLTLLGDAGHMASDSFALIIAAIAAWMAQRPPSHKHSYGFGRAEVITAWISSAALVALSILLIIKATERIQHPTPVHGLPVLFIAAIGILVNGALTWWLSRGERTLNTRAALLHVLSDLIATSATLLSGILIYFTGWVLIDPILSILISILILISSYRLLRESMRILMEGVPHHLNIAQVSETMITIEEVKAVHDVHIWTVSSNMTALSAHVDIHDLRHWDNALIKLQSLLQEKYKINHITLQPEIGIKKCDPCL